MLFVWSVGLEPTWGVYDGPDPSAELWELFQFAYDHKDIIVYNKSICQVFIEVSQP